MMDNPGSSVRHCQVLIFFTPVHESIARKDSLHHYTQAHLSLLPFIFLHLFFLSSFLIEEREPVWDSIPRTKNLFSSLTLIKLLVLLTLPFIRCMDTPPCCLQRVFFPRDRSSRRLLNDLREVANCLSLSVFLSLLLE